MVIKAPFKFPFPGSGTMDYREQLFRPLTKHFVDLIAQDIFENPTDFDIVYNLIFDAEMKVAWRAAWTCQKISEKQPKWFTDKHFDELSTLALSTSHCGLHRGCLCVLNNIALPNSIPVHFINACFEWMISPKSPISVQALSMKMLYSICQKEPDFKPELIAYLENIDYESYSAGFNSTRKNIIKKLNYS